MIDSDALIKNIRMLPPLPAAVDKLCKLASNTNSDVFEVAQVISGDHALTAKLLKVVNSAFYSLSQKVSTIFQAVIILGYREIRSIAMGFSVMNISKSLLLNACIPIEEFWKHSLGTAILSKKIAKKFRYKDPEEVFVAGLLHDIGKLILMDYSLKEYSDILQKTELLEQRLYEVEKKTFGIDHAQVGEKLSQYWKIPSSVCTAIGNHHSFSLPKEGNEITFFVQMADCLTKRKNIGFTGNFKPMETPFPQTPFSLTQEEMDSLSNELAVEMIKMEAFYNISKESDAR